MRHAATCDVVTGLTDLDRATAICAALNRYTAGWAYIVEPSEARIVAHTSVDCPSDWQLPILRWIDAALISMWHAAVIAPALAEAVGGQIDASYPEGAAGVRTEPDELMAYSDSLRSRPEWVTSPGGARWRDIGPTAAILQHALNDDAAQAPAGPGFDLQLDVMTLTGRMQDQPGIGHGFEARAVLTAPAEADTDPNALANALNWLVLAGEAPSVAGAWTVAERGELVFRAFTMDFALDHMVAAEVVDGEAEVLATISLEVAAGAAELPEGLLGDPEAASTPEAGPELEPSELAALGVLAAIWQPALEAVSTALAGTVPAASDPRLLLLPRPQPGSGVAPIATWGVVDPRGPELTCLALVGTADDDARLLVALRRSPVDPDFRIRAGVRAGSAPVAAVADAIAELVTRVPDFVDLSGCPAELLPVVADAFRAGVARVAPAADLPSDWFLQATSDAAIAEHSAALAAAWEGAKYIDGAP